jgi:hypothetical protein
LTASVSFTATHSHSSEHGGISLIRYTAIRLTFIKNEGGRRRATLPDLIAILLRQSGSAANNLACVWLYG